MKNRLQKIISETIKEMLSEDDADTSNTDASKESSPKETLPKQTQTQKKDEKPSILTKGAFGSGGRSRSFVASAKARAESDPKGLMKDLGITSSSSGDDLEKVLRILNAAIHSNGLMSQGYVGVSRRSDTLAGEKDAREVVTIKMSSLDRKNGIRFLAHTLTAAQNAGFLNLKKSVQFAIGSTHPIIIHSV